MALMNNNLTPRANEAIAHAAKIAKSYNHSYMGTGHLLLGLLQREGEITELLERMGIVQAHFVAQLKVVYDEQLAGKAFVKLPIDAPESAAPPPPPQRPIVYRYYLLADDTVGWFAAIVKTPEKEDDSNRGHPIDIPNEVRGPFLDNLFSREHAFGNRPYGNNYWSGWSISQLEYDRLARLIELAPAVRESQRLAALQ